MYRDNMLVLFETKHHVVVAAWQELADCVAVHLVTHLPIWSTWWSQCGRNDDDINEDQNNQPSHDDQHGDHDDHDNVEH